MSWPVVLPNGWCLTEMALLRRAYHVRRHLLSPPEEWHELTGLSRADLKAMRGDFKALGLRYGKQAVNARYRPTRIDEVAYEAHYRPAAFQTVADSLKQDGDYVLRETDGKVFAEFISPSCLIVAARGRPSDVCWRTAFRLTLGAGETPRKKRRQYVRKLNEYAFRACASASKGVK